jgi:hypothetical protein
VVRLIGLFCSTLAYFLPVSMAERSKASTFSDCKFESCWGHGCLSASFCVVLSCVGRGLALD